MVKPKPSLCFRCEHRARYLEDKNIRPRFECGQITQSTYACYSFLPVKPIITTRLKGDRRPEFGPTMFSSRITSVEYANLVATLVKVRKGKIFCWIPSSFAKLIKK